MTSKAYKTMVGAFVVGGIALFTIGIVLLGGGAIFNDSLKYVLYFDGSVSGLSIGAPVVFRGVPMGSVTQISLVANARDSNVTIPVTIRIDERSFIRASGATLSEHAQSEIIRRMVERGLRARLQMGSLITGQYRVELDFFPRTPMNFRSSNPDSEIPTIPSPIDTLQKTLERLPLESMADSLTTILTNLTLAVSDGKLEKAVEAFTGSFDELKNLLANKELLRGLDDALTGLGAASKSVQKGLSESFSSLGATLSSITRAADQIRKLSDSAENVIGRDSATMNDLRRMLRDTAAAARALRNFADMLERNPEALLLGRQGKR